MEAVRKLFSVVSSYFLRDPNNFIQLDVPRRYEDRGRQQWNKDPDMSSLLLYIMFSIQIK